MSESSQKKTAGILASVVIGVIVISFMFSGYDTMKGSADSIAKVGRESIKADEFNQEYSRMIQFYGQIMGGKDLTAKQIEQFRIKDAALKNLVQRKMLVNLADDLEFVVSNSTVATQIQALPYFLTNNVFDLNKYKMLLQNNRLTTDQFENSIREDMTLQKINSLFSYFPISTKMKEEIEGFKSAQVELSVVKIVKNNLQKKIIISSNEVAQYISDPKNEQALKARFESSKKSLEGENQVKAKHILLSIDGKSEDEVKKSIEQLRKTVTAANFSKIAKERSEDPSAKENSGDLGWFTREKMVPAFSDVAFKLSKGEISAPIKTDFGYHIIYVEDKKSAKIVNFDDVKILLAKELLQESKKADVVALAKALSEKVKGLLHAGDYQAIESLKSEYGFEFEMKKSFNLYDGYLGSIPLSPEQLATISKSKDETQLFDSALSYIVTKRGGALATATGAKPEDLAQIFSNRLQSELMQELQGKIKVKVFVNLDS